MFLGVLILFMVCLVDVKLSSGSEEMGQQKKKKKRDCFLDLLRRTG